MVGKSIAAPPVFGLGLGLALLLALAACHKAAPDAPKSQAEVKAVVAQMAKPRAGLYRSTSTLVSFEVPGMPPAAAERFKALFGSAAQGRDYCITPAQAEGGYKEMTDKLGQGHCNYTRFDVTGANLDALMTCEVGKGMASTIAMKGTVTAEGSQLRMEVNRATPGLALGGIKLVADVAAQRVGDCPASGPPAG